jgi:hypothetical protein
MTCGALGRSTRGGAAHVCGGTACTLDGTVTSPTWEVAGYTLSSDRVDGESWMALGHAWLDDDLRGKTEER